MDDKEPILLDFHLNLRISGRPVIIALVGAREKFDADLARITHDAIVKMQADIQEQFPYLTVEVLHDDQP